jgi:hypothetical protein
MALLFRTLDPGTLFLFPYYRNSGVQ